LKWRQKPRDNYKVFVEVHQNGEVLSTTSRPFTKRGSIFLTSHPDGELTAPFYALPTDIRILKITKRGVEVDLDPNWEGFTTFEGKIEDINSDRKSAYTHIMKKGDYGSIAYNDLRVLIRIGKERQTRLLKETTSKEYRGSSLELWFGGRHDLKFLAIGLGAALWFMGGFVLGLLKKPDDRPRDFIDLRNEYTLPFIHPKHLRNVPESLQVKYDRLVPIRSALEFAKGFTDTLLGYDALKSHPARHPVFLESRQHYRQLYRKLDDDIDTILAQRDNLEGRILNDARNALVALPYVRGESFRGSLLRLEDKLNIWHENAQLTLSLRKKTTQEFTADKHYDFNEYRKTVEPTTVQFFRSEPSGEEAMYKEVEQLARFAELHQKRIVKYREPVVPVTVENSSPLVIAADSSFLRLIEEGSFRNFNEKISQIQASIFDPDKPKIVREPLIGTIDPKLIEQTIARYRFELQLCYELALRRNQQAVGSMEWQWHLDTQGKVYDIDLVKSSISDPKMIECVRGKIARWKWPKPQKGSIQISYPFLFRPAKG
jgi:hypothetical protein